MKEVLEPLVRIAGVRKAVLVSDDGVPIAALDAESSSPSSAVDQGPCGEGDSAAQLHALSGLALGWMGEVRRAIDPLSWDPPEHMVLRAARGTLLAMRAPGCLLLVILERGTQPEDLRVPMGAAVARIQRVLRRPAPEPPGVHPSTKTSAPNLGGVDNELMENGVPGASGER